MSEDQGCARSEENPNITAMEFVALVEQWDSKVATEEGVLNELKTKCCQHLERSRPSFIMDGWMGKVEDDGRLKVQSNSNAYRMAPSTARAFAMWIQEVYGDAYASET